MSKGTVEMYDKHIIKSQKGELPLDEQFGFVGTDNTVYYAGQAVFDADHAGSGSEDDDEEEAETFSSEIADAIGDDLKPRKGYALRDVKPEVHGQPDYLSDVPSDQDFGLPAPNTASGVEERVVEIPSMQARVSLDLASPHARDLDGSIRCRTSIIPWKGGMIPIRGGPTLPGGVEIVLLDEHNLFREVQLFSNPGLAHSCTFDLFILRIDSGRWPLSLRPT